jgi:hypothetical protein
LPDDGHLPTLLLQLLAPTPASLPDYRTLDATQIQRSYTAHEAPQRQPGRTTDLRLWLALAAGVLFGLERLIAQRRFKPATA